MNTPTTRRTFLAQSAALTASLAGLGPVAGAVAAQAEATEPTRITYRREGPSALSVMPWSDDRQTNAIEIDGHAPGSLKFIKGKMTPAYKPAEPKLDPLTGTRWATYDHDPDGDFVYAEFTLKTS